MTVEPSHKFNYSYDKHFVSSILYKILIKLYKLP